MIRAEKGKIDMEGNASTLMNELAVLTVAIKDNVTSRGVSSEDFDSGLALSIRAQTMAYAGMTIDEVEEVLGIPIDRKKSHYGDDGRVKRPSEE